VQITQKLNPVLGSIKITHPFHPLRDQNFDILKVREINGARHYSLRADSGVICVPESWTDRQIQQKQQANSPTLRFDAAALKELVVLLQALEQFSKAPKTIGNSNQ
jgi:hypothetical protein